LREHCQFFIAAVLVELEVKFLNIARQTMQEVLWLKHEVGNVEMQKAQNLGRAVKPRV